MSGYTPVFGSVFDGTLHGRWPQTGVWLALLAMADRHGNIDRTPRAIASDIGLSESDLMSCIAEFCEPDPMSRTQAFEGRRLVPIEEGRAWGWRIVNHGLYREKARLQAKNSVATETGSDAERKRQERMSADVRRCPPESASPDIDINTDLNQEKTSSLRSDGARTRKNAPDTSKRARSCTVPDSFTLTVELRSWTEKTLPDCDVDATFQRFRVHEFKRAYHDWPKVWQRWVLNAKKFGEYDRRQTADWSEATKDGRPPQWM